MNFHVVDFHDGLHVIPFGWLTDYNKQSYWPPYKETIRLCKAVVNMETPVIDVWDLVDVKAILASTDKYPDAVEKLKLIKDASDLENIATEESTKKTRAKRHRVQVPPSSSDDEEAGAPAVAEVINNKKPSVVGNEKKPPATLPKKPANFVTVTENVRVVDIGQLLAKNGAPSTSAIPLPAAGDKSAKEKDRQQINADKTVDSERNRNDGSIPLPDPPSDAPEMISLQGFHKELLRVMTKMSSTVNEIDKRLKDVETKVVSLTTKPRNVQNNNEFEERDPLDDGLPLGTVNQFEEFEKKLNNKEFASRVVQLLKTLGGKDTHDFLFNALKRCLKNELACKYSMDGKKKKKPFKPTNFLKTITKAALLHKPADTDEDQVRKIVSGWLAGAKLRHDRELAKRNVGLPEPPAPEQERERGNEDCA